MICNFKNGRLPWLAIYVALWAALASGNHHDRPVETVAVQAHR